ncbi:hypothetical protein SDC9_178305 [bioreactor metagenome]|uniref:Uncharacterized protein n=1 Tax=bioreactor metagenome TaxID=1076179 RepID=A0A645H3E4_9ZZZZ
MTVCVAAGRADAGAGRHDARAPDGAGVDFTAQRDVDIPHVAKRPNTRETGHQVRLNMSQRL